MHWKTRVANGAVDKVSVIWAENDVAVDLVEVPGLPAGLTLKFQNMDQDTAAEVAHVTAAWLGALKDLAK